MLSSLAIVVKTGDVSYYKPTGLISFTSTKKNKEKKKLEKRKKEKEKRKNVDTAQHYRVTHLSGVTGHAGNQAVYLTSTNTSYACVRVCVCVCVGGGGGGGGACVLAACVCCVCARACVRHCMVCLGQG